VFAAHKIILSSGIYGIENLTSALSGVPAKGATVMVMPMKIRGGTGAPTRVFALCPNNNS
jgi:kynurenine formamidase